MVSEWRRDAGRGRGGTGGAVNEARWLPASDAARYVGLETEGFRRAVRRGTLPPASYKLGPQSPRWDRIALDRAMGVEDARNSTGEAVDALAAEIKAEAQAKSGTKAARGRLDQNLRV